ncbi:MAG: hypothetical protein ACRD40_07400 [Candidatus Acidiferrales bacterium]
MCESEEAKGDGVVVEWERKMIAAVAAVGKWESRGLGGIPIARSISHDVSIALTRLTYVNPA